MASKGKWGVVVGKPTKLNDTKRNRKFRPGGRGSWLVDAKFDTRQEARDCAKRAAADNIYWNFHPKKRP